MRSLPSDSASEASPRIAPGEDATTADPRKETPWTVEITPVSGWFHLPIRELWEYRDLLWMLVQRDIVTFYKQTILGPIWFGLQPLLTMVMYVLVFGEIAGISTDGLPRPLFYLSGIVLWNYFAESFTRTSGTFVLNAEIFGKVYFPRLIIPLSLVVSGLIKFLIQLGLFLAFYCYFLTTGSTFHPSWGLFLAPLLTAMVAGLGLGLGILCSALTAKYRDLNLVIPFGVQLLLFATPVVYPMSAVSGPLQQALRWNPLSPILEAFRYGFFGVGELTLSGMCYAATCTIALLGLGLVFFHRIEKSVIDIV